MMNATPRVIPMTPSVAMNGGSRTRTIRIELSAPAASPTVNAIAIEMPSGQSAPTNKLPQTTLASAMTEPGDRSMPPEMMTTAAPTAAMP
jgi:hypothetical protein